jgi:hypothetical protein
VPDARGHRKARQTGAPTAAGSGRRVAGKDDVIRMQGADRVAHAAGRDERIENRGES